MKKFCVMLCLIFLTHSVYANFPESCYATNKCGLKSSLQGLVAAGGAISGSKVGLLVAGGVGFVMGGVAGYVVGNNLGGKIGYSADEYLYFEDGTCLECDTYQIGENYECSNGIIVSNGSNVYRCVTRLLNDVWEKMDLLPCADSQIQNLNVENTIVEIDSSISKPIYDGVNAYSGDACLRIQCADGYNFSDGKCVENKEPEKENNDEEDDNENIVSSCTQRYGCYNLPADKQKACVACCSVSASVANWNQNTQICECVNKSQTFNPDTKVCSGGDTVSAPVVIAPTPTEPEKYDCDINKLLELRAKHSTNSEIVSLIDELIEKCEEGITETEYNSLYINITVVITNIRDAGLSSSRTNILNAISKLDNLSSGFKESVWKNEEGKFNTSRLISDSVAGVVLGTAGGLITSSVVKKNQVENGFEDIQCTVGGQVVAGWGDQFQVGIQ